MKATWTIRTLNNHRKQLCSVQSQGDLCRLLKKELFHLQLLGKQPPYHLFAVRKRDGSPRWIEDPEPPLKEVQRTLNSHLQGVYYFQRSDAAYGFVVNARDDVAPRSIVSNAQCHTGKNYLLNIDLEDFFHQVKSERIFEICERPPFRFKQEASELVVQLTTHQGRLPMGAPTSPILSNFAVIGLDEELLRFSRRNQLTYTRYADDLVFSSEEAITHNIVSEIRSIILSHQLVINEDKVKLYGKEEPRQVTGLKITDKVALPDDYLPKVIKEIEKLQNVMEVNQRFKTLQSNKQLDQLKAMVKGHINFAAVVMGERHQTVQSLLDQFEAAIDPPNDFESASWLEFDYL